MAEAVAEMSRNFVADVGAMEPGDRAFVEIAGRSVSVFVLEKSYVAYENICPHMGGPVCEGRIMPRVEGIVDDAGRLVAERSNDDKPQLICPWHGWEYDLRTGRCVGDRTKSLRTYLVEVQDGKIYVVA
jgi:nitrite reductase/ring-hydroxylating ferredoxin subunit